MKKFTAIMMTIIMAVCALMPVVSALTPAEEAKLQFNEDGTFKIMNLSDIQDDATLTSLTADFIDAAVAAEVPDLIVLTGDNIAGHTITSADKTEKAIREFMDILEPYGIPVAIVFGNHDSEGNELSREDQMKVYSEYSCFIGIDEGEALEGCGTYNVPVYSSTDAGDIVFNCWLFDTGSYDENGGYDHMRENQLNWYKEKSAELKAENGGEPVPAIAFQHIIVPEIFEALVEVDASVPGAVPKYGKYYAFPETAAEGSYMGESPCPSAVNGGQFDAMLECGDVFAVVSGHDHTNSFIVPYKGIDIINTPTCGFKSYGTSETRGIRMFVINEAEPTAYETYIVQYGDIFGDDMMAMFVHDIVAFFSDLMATFNALWNKISSMFGI